MNKYLFILGIVGTALLSACSSDDLAMVLSPEEEETIVVEAGKDSDVPITLGVSSSRGLTRAVVNPDAFGNFKTEEGKYLGVFCLATDIQSNVDESMIPEVIRTNNWNTAAEDDKAGLIVRMNNVPAKVTTDGTTSDVTFLDASTLTNPTPSVQHYYYPMGNWMKYNFYAYYPRQEKVVDGNTTLSFSANQVLEKYYEIDGSQDIIWGMSDQENATTVDPSTATDADPYCAKYFRLWKEADGAHIENYYPKFEFKHKLVQFRFFVIATDDALAKEMKIANMYISNAVYRLSLIVANKTNEADTKNGQLNLLGDFKTDTLYIKENGKNTNRFNGTPPFDININNTSVDVSSDTPVGYIMLARPDVAYEKKADYKYKLVVRVQYKDGTKTRYKNVPRFMTPPEGGFQEGKIYNIVVKVGLSGGIPN